MYSLNNRLKCAVVEKPLSSAMTEIFLSVCSSILRAAVMRTLLRYSIKLRLKCFLNRRDK